MNQRTIAFTKENIFLFVIGYFIVGFGVNITIRSGLGAGPWDTVTANLHELANITLGTASLLISMTLFTIIVLYRKQARFFFMLIPLVIVALFIDLWDLVLLGELMPSNISQQMLFFILGLLTIPLGLALPVLSNFPAMVFDELMLMMMDVFKTKNLIYVRLGIELFAIVFASVMGLLAGIGFGAVNFGSVVIAVTLAPILHFYIHTYQRFRGQNNA